MEDNKNFELPTAAEKLSHKFIFDALRPKNAWEIPSEEPVKPAPTPEEEIKPAVDTEDEPSASEAICGTKADPPPAEPMEEVFNEVSGSDPLSQLHLPEGKKYFRIGEVSEVVGVEPYVLRYWENEFSMVRPVKSKSGQRVYARKDVETLYLIKHLLHVEKFSMQGAKKKLQERRKQANQANQANQISVQKQNETLKTVASELKELIAILKADPGC